MQTRHPLFDDMAKMMIGAADAAQGVAREAGAMARSSAMRAASDLDLAPREDVEAALAVAREALEKVETLEAKIAALEARLERE